MAILIILGLFAGLYMLWLLFKLATFALPFYAGLGLFLWCLHHGHGIVLSVLVGSGAGLFVLAAGKFLFGLALSPLHRSLIAAVFVLPAAIAGYNAVYGLAGLLFDKGLVLTVLSSLGALTIATSAWTHLAASAGGAGEVVSA